MNIFCNFFANKRTNSNGMIQLLECELLGAISGGIASNEPNCNTAADFMALNPPVLPPVILPQLPPPVPFNVPPPTGTSRGNG